MSGSPDWQSKVLYQQGSLRALVHSHSHEILEQHGITSLQLEEEQHDSSSSHDEKNTMSNEDEAGFDPYVVRKTWKHSSKHRKGSSGYTVTYDSASHLTVLFQMWGSVWPMVLPYCLVNMVIAAVIQVLNSLESIDLTISDESHSFMNLLVAFLLVSRVTISVSRYMDARECLGIMDTCVRELLQVVCILTRGRNTAGDKDWRNQVAYRTLILFRTVIAVMDYGSDQVPAWDIPELDDQESLELQQQLMINVGTVVRSDLEETMRVPIVFAYQLRCCLDEGREKLSKPMDELRSLKLFETVDKFMEGYYGIRKFLTTPVPFPLIQMSRTFLFFYIFTVPFALLSDVSSPVAHIVVIFMLTFGFVGLELVAIELDDPFGNDPNDFNNLAMALTNFEDAYMLLTIVDGEESTNKLRSKMQRSERHKQERRDEEAAPGTGNNEKSRLLGRRS